eukprot:jgi/Chlat1/7703/Chrsp66S07187
MAAKGQVDLLDFIEWQSVECLNEHPSHTWQNVLKQGYREDDGLRLASDADEQLLLYVPFNQMIRLHSIAFKAATAASSEEETNNDRSGPRVVKLFINTHSIGFSEAGSDPATQTLELSPSQVETGEPLQLYYVKFQSVRSLTIFIESNQKGTDVTELSKIQLFGNTVETTDMSKFKKIEEGHA